MSIDEIIEKTGTKTSKGKDRYAYIARAMLGIKKNKIEEFEKAGIQIKAVCFEYNGNLKESMFLQYISIMGLLTKAGKSLIFTTQ